MSGYFNGRYYKHQKDGHTVCFIVGHTKNNGFIQVITNQKTWQYDSLDNCKISDLGIQVNLPDIQGEVQYGPLLPLRSDIMGPFRFLPMQCSHSVVSMAHSLTGELRLAGAPIVLTGGKGYIEGDRGRSFPKTYLWLQCNDFPDDCSIMASVADIPFVGMHFMGCICAIVYKGQEYRLATYRGVKVCVAGKEKLVLKQGQYRLEADIDGRQAFALKAPTQGRMVRTIHESNSTYARFRFWVGTQLLFDFDSPHVSFECHLDEKSE